jgi:hypothetical protein
VSVAVSLGTTPPRIGQHSLQHIIDGDDTDDPIVVLEDRDDGEVEVGHTPRHFRKVVVDMHRCVAVLDEVRYPHASVGAEQLDERHGTGEVSVVEQEHVGGDLGQDVCSAHRGERIAHGCIGRDRHEVGTHESPGAALSITQQCANLRLLRRWQERKNRSASGLIELGDEVGRIVRTHLGEHCSRLGVGFVAEKLNLVLGIQLLEDIGLELGIAVHRGDDLLTLVM